MTDSQILKAARKLLPLLDGLLGAKAPAAKKELQTLLAQAAKGTKGAAQKILALLNTYPAVRRWLKDAVPVAKRPAAEPIGGRTKVLVKKAARTKVAPKKASARRGAPKRSARRGAILGVAPGGVGFSGPADAEAEAPMPAGATYTPKLIHFATDRLPSGDTTPAKFFTGDPAPAGTMTYGTCLVSVPADHKKGKFERPFGLWKIQLSEDPNKHFVLLQVSTLETEAFFASAGGGGPQALVFVHGFNVTFRDAALRTAQMAVDLPFDGVPILYSWPSKGSAAPFAYTTDQTSADRSVPHLQQFLEDLVAKSHFETVHILAHSMGNRVVTQALLRMAPTSKVKFHQVVLAAPDVDKISFKDDMAAKVVAMAARVTLYANSQDVALKVSRKINGKPRAGDSDDGVVVFPGMDSVDATGIDNSFLKHSYFDAVRTVLEDVFFVLRGDLAASRKTTLKVAPTGTYYQFVL